MHLPDSIRALDYKVFSKMNGQWHTLFFDTFLPFVREPFVWLPFYFFLVLFTTINFKRRGAYWVLFFIANAGLSDYISSTILKGAFSRQRPCSDPSIANTVRFLVSYCPGNSSFPSSHAVNHFAAAMFIFTTFKKTVSPKWAFIFLWAFAVCYAQVYVGVHFPFDVFCGAIIGLILGYLPAKLFNTKIGLLPN